LTNDLLNTFGGFGVVEIANMQDLLQFICENGFEHHVAGNISCCAAAVHEALTKYKGWDIYLHE
jgi:L-fucose isomerase-like protein